jgi:hypothetical protein
VVGDRQRSAVPSMIGHCVVVNCRERPRANPTDCRVSMFDPIVPTLCLTPLSPLPGLRRNAAQLSTAV